MQNYQVYFYFLNQELSSQVFQYYFSNLKKRCQVISSTALNFVKRFFKRLQVNYINALIINLKSIVYQNRFIAYLQNFILLSKLSNDKRMLF